MAFSIRLAVLDGTACNRDEDGHIMYEFVSARSKNGRFGEDSPQGE